MNQKKAAKLFLGKITLLTLFLLIIVFALRFLFPQLPVPSTTLYVFLFFFVITYLVHLMLLWADKKSDQQFIRLFMLSTMLKLFLYIAFILLLVYLNRDEAKGTIALFLILYVLYSGLEIISISAYLQGKRTTQSSTE